MSATGSSVAFSQSLIYDWVHSAGSDASDPKQIQTRSMSNNPPERKGQVQSKKIKKAAQKSKRKSRRSQQNANRNLSGDSSTSNSDQSSVHDHTQNSSCPSPTPSRSLDDMLRDALESTQLDPDVPPPVEVVEQLTKFKIYAEYLEQENMSIKQENASIKTERELLLSELKDADRITGNLKKKNKKLTLDNDTLLRNASKQSGVRRFTDISQASTQTVPEPERTPTNTRDQPQTNDLMIAQLNSLRDHVTKVAHDLLSTVEECTAPLRRSSPSPSNPSPSPENNADQFNPVQNRRNRQRVPTERTAPVDVASRHVNAPPSYANVTQGTRRPGQGKRYRNRKKVIIVGTSLTDGISSELRNHDIDSTTYKYSGGKIDLIRERIPHLFPRDISKQPDKIVLLAGGNDAEDSTADRTMNAYEGLIRDVKKVCPQSKILISSIPPRKGNRVINNKIEEVNDYLKDRGQRKDNVKFVDIVPVEPDMFTYKKVHFNQRGKSLLASRLKSFLVD